ncbi:hypothetical protein Hanom_Chr07g00663221 [Helianthus anomalus]
MTSSMVADEKMNTPLPFLVSLSPRICLVALLRSLLLIADYRSILLPSVCSLTIVHTYIIMNIYIYIYKRELTAIFVPVICPIMPVQAKFQICTIFVPDVLETCQFRPQKLTSVKTCWHNWTNHRDKTGITRRWFFWTELV